MQRASKVACWPPPFVQHEVVRQVRPLRLPPIFPSLAAPLLCVLVAVLAVTEVEARPFRWVAPLAPLSLLLVLAVAPVVLRLPLEQPPKGGNTWKVVRLVKQLLAARSKTALKVGLD